LDIAKAIFIYFLSSLKFFAGPSGGYLAGFNIFVTIALSIGGMMTSVVLFTFFGKWMKRRFFDRLRRNRPTFSKRRRQAIGIWRRYGAFGVAMLTPVLLMPIGGTIIMVSFNTPKRKIISYMLLSAVFWAVLECTLIYMFGDELLEYFSMFIFW